MEEYIKKEVESKSRIGLNKYMGLLLILMDLLTEIDFWPFKIMIIHHNLNSWSRGSKFKNVA